MGVSKELLIIGNPPCGSRWLTQAMTSHGWSTRYASDLQDVSNWIKEYPAPVGIMYLDAQELPRATEIESVLDCSDAKWVALIDQEPSSQAVSQLIADMFYAYCILPVEPGELDRLLSHALNMVRLATNAGQQNGRESAVGGYEMVGSTPVMNALFRTIAKVAAVDAPVFIGGESGTGKELTARAIHERSVRAKGPFGAVNCGALPDNLIQSELFGHEKGAFTGANQRKIGRIEASAGGTLFLDEIGDLSLELQVNLLRFLEDHKIQRIGSLEEIHIDVRVLAATHVDLEKSVREGRFREDLYHRLNVLQVNIPPLRERQEDIELLAKYCFDKFSHEKSIVVRGFSQEALTLLRQYDWPGNVRELINRIRRAMVMCEHRLIRPADLGLERRRYSRRIVTLEQARDVAERDAVKAALARNKNKVQHAARELGVSRVTLYRLIEKHGIMRNAGAKTEQRGSQELTGERSSK